MNVVGLGSLRELKVYADYVIHMVWSVLFLLLQESCIITNEEALSSDSSDYMRFSVHTFYSVCIVLK